MIYGFRVQGLELFHTDYDTFGFMLKFWLQGSWSMW